MQCFVGTQKNRLNETLAFVYSNAYFCKTRTECKIFDSILFAIKLLLAQTILKARCEMSEIRAHFKLKRVIFKWVPICR